MTVGELRGRMSAAEYLEWGRFLAWRQREERWQAHRARTRAGDAQRAPARRTPGAGGR